MFDLGTVVVVGSIIVAAILLLVLARYGPGPSMISAGLALMLPQVPKLVMPWMDKMLGYTTDNGMAQNWADALVMTPTWAISAMSWMVWVGVVLIAVGVPAQIRRNYRLHHHHGSRRTMLS